MKRSYIFIALAMVVALSMVSCKCTSKKSQEPTQEEVQKMKQALADTVLAYIDDCVEKLCDATSKSFRIQTMELTDEEKMVKPDYLLDPSIANTLVTKSQKVNALAIYLFEIGIRKLYDMPNEETKEVAIKLAAELNHPVDIDIYKAEIPRSERIKLEYDKCKENGDLAYFWQFQNAVIAETGYILAQNPELLFSKISDEEWQSFYERTKANRASIETLAKHDEEMASLLEGREQHRVTSSEKELDNSFSSVETAKQHYIANKDKYAAKRNALLQ